MATSKSALKRLRTSKKKRICNKAKKSEMTTCEKKYLAAVESGNAGEAKELLNKCLSLLDKAAKTGTIHKNKSNRKKARLMKLAKAAN